MPRWDEEADTLKQKYDSNRVRFASAKNFVLVNAPSRDRSFEREGDSNIMMQFGKLKKSQYIMDHTGPLSTLQAFAVGLSMCHWIGESV
jgi:hypothetical protein